MKRVISIVGLACLVIMAAGGNVYSQDFGQLLAAVDKLEANLKAMVEKESSARATAISELRSEISQTPSGGAGPWKQLQADLKALRAEVQLLKQAPGTPGVEPLEVAAIISDIEFLKAENLYLRGVIGKSTKQWASEETDYPSQNDQTLQRLTTAIASLNERLVGTTERPKSKPSVGPKYHNLRFQDNYSYLNNPANRGVDLFDPLKNIGLGGSAKLTFGGHYRFRYESDNNRKLGASDPTSQEVYLNRLFLHADFRVSNVFGLFAEFKWAGIRNNELAAPPIAHDRPDIHNLFVDGWAFNNKNVKLGLRLGRQELQFGKQRLISPLDWANTRRIFEGVRIMSKFSGWSIDGFVTRPVTIKPTEFNTPDLNKTFSGIYATRRHNKHLFSAYFLAYTNDAPSGQPGDFTYLTLGSGYDGKAGKFDWSTEAAFQFGQVGEDNLSAHMVSLSGGYTFKEHDLKPRIGLNWDLASGDGDPSDGKAKTFHHLFPLGHAYFGWADQVGRRNMHAASVQLSAHPSKTVTTKLNWFSFNLLQKEDALYNAGGKATRLDVTGASGRHVGNELDALIIIKLNRHASFHLGYLHFAPGGFIKNTGTSESHNMLYMMLPVKF